MLMNKHKAYAFKLLVEKIGSKHGPIKSIKPLHSGYTNKSVVATYTDGTRYQVRMPHCSDFLNRDSEYLIHKLLGNDDFVYFDRKTGVAIKKWINGNCPHVFARMKWTKIDDLFSQIKKIHDINIKKTHTFKKINLNAYTSNLYRLNLAHQTRFIRVLDLYSKDPVVLNHTDINPANIIQDEKGNLHIIDFEWSALASDYWDYANFIREAGITWYDKIEWNKYIKNFDMQKLNNYIFICSVFAYLWTWQMPQTKKIRMYRLKTLHQISISNKENN